MGVKISVTNDTNKIVNLYIVCKGTFPNQGPFIARKEPLKPG